MYSPYMFVVTEMVIDECGQASPDLYMSSDLNCAITMFCLTLKPIYSQITISHNI